MSCTTEAVVMSQKDVTFYIAVLPVKQLLEHARVDYYGPDAPDGYQRPLEAKRLRAVSKYVRDDEAILPTSVLLSLRPDEEVIFERYAERGGNSNAGRLTIPSGCELWVIDGQHRLFGLERAIEKDGAYYLEDYSLQVTIMEISDRYAEMLYFHIVNTTQKKLQTDIVDRHLDQMRRTLGPDLIRNRGGKTYQRARAVAVVDRLNELACPWKDNIKIPGVPGREAGLVRQHALVASLDPVLRDASTSIYDDDDLAAMLSNYWNALQTLMPEAFQSPSDYRVQATSGIYSLHIAFPTVVQLCAGEFSTSKMVDVLRNASFSSDFWHRVDGDVLTRGTGMGSIRELAGRIVEDLTAAVAPPVAKAS